MDKPVNQLFDRPAPPKPLDGEITPPVAKRGDKAAAKRAAKDARDGLTKSFMNDVQKIWDEQGESILRRAAFYEPMKFAQMVAGLAPKTFEIQNTNVQEIPDERLEEVLEAVSGLLTRGTGSAAEKAIRRAGRPRKPEQAEALPALREAEGLPRGE